MQEMFIQHLAEEAHTQAKLERKPRRNIQYKDVGKSHHTPSNPLLLSPSQKKANPSKKANAISHRDNLEFLEDVAPKTVSLKKAKAINQARLRGEPLPDAAPSRAATNGAKKPKGAAAAAAVNGQPKAGTNPFTLSLRGEEREKKDAGGDGPSDQLELEMRQAAQPEEDADVDMTG